MRRVKSAFVVGNFKYKIFFAFLLLFLVNCGKDEDPKPLCFLTSAKTSFVGKLGYSTLPYPDTFYTYEFTNNRMTAMEFTLTMNNPPVTTRSTLNYDDKGNISTTISPTYTYSYDYSPDGNITSEKIYYPDNTLLYLNEYSYIDGRLTRIRYYYQGAPQRFTTFEYGVSLTDPIGSKEYLTSSAVPYRTTTYYYDDKKGAFSEMPEAVKKWAKLNGNGLEHNRIKMIEVYSGLSTPIEYNWTFEYNSENRPTKSTGTITNNPDFKTISEYTYSCDSN